ncbi:response regulator [Ureibacillus sp. GCM10028918]|uniref:response regulator transcription factor n=1 Tax=Ureibacillus sp. GCM10028918 TaxID=3273429 RepID=UPI003611FF3F
MTLKVFIVEDDPMVLEVNKSFLNRITGFSVTGEAQSGNEAYKKISKMKPNLILLDMYLPDMSGIELLQKIRNESIPSDVIMVTAASDAKTIQQVVRMGAFDYLVKPFRFERFQEALQKYQRTTKRIPNSQILKQEEIDMWLGHKIREEITLPKGLNEITMKQILDALMEHNEPITSEQLAQNVGMARVTVRRYLDFLAKNEKVFINLKYGTVGRPTKFYSN